MSEIVKKFGQQVYVRFDANRNTETINDDLRTFRKVRSGKFEVVVSPDGYLTDFPIRYLDGKIAYDMYVNDSIKNRVRKAYDFIDRYAEIFAYAIDKVRAHFSVPVKEGELIEGDNSCYIYFTDDSSAGFYVNPRMSYEIHYIRGIYVAKVGYTGEYPKHLHVYVPDYRKVK